MIRWLVPFLLLWPSAARGETIEFSVLPPLTIVGDQGCVELEAAKTMFVLDAQLKGLADLRAALDEGLADARKLAEAYRQSLSGDAKVKKMLEDENDRLNGEVVKMITERNKMQAALKKPSWGWVVAAGVSVVAVGLAIALGVYAAMTR